MQAFDKHYDSNERMIIVRDVEEARLVLGSQNFIVPDLGSYLAKLEAATDESFTFTKLFINVSPFFLEGARHSELRALAMQFFEPKNITLWDEFLQHTIMQILHNMQGKKELDLVSEIAMPVFLDIAQPMLGLKPTEPEFFFHKAMKLQQLVEPMQSLKRIKQFESDLARLVNGLEPRHKQLNSISHVHTLPSFMTMMAEKTMMDEHTLNAFTITMFAAIAPLAQTAVNMLAYIYTHHDGIAPNEDEFHGAFDIYLAKATAPKYIHRTALVDHYVGDKSVTAGKTVLIDMQALAGDAIPGMACPHRMPFGLGQHFCVGSALSKKVLKILVPLFIKQYPRLKLGQAQRNDANLIAHEFLSFCVTPE